MNLERRPLLVAGRTLKDYTALNDEIEQDLRASARAQLDGREDRWRFERGQGSITEQLITAATNLRDEHPGDTVVIVVGSSSQGVHRLVGSVAVSLARRSPVPIVIVP